MQRSGLKPAFSGTIEPTPVPLAYRLGLAVVALTMLLLPVLYLALIGATGVGVWWHLTENTWIMSGPGRSNQWRVIAYAAPAVAGLVLMFFMVKPILARPSRRQDPLPVDRIAEPALFALIDEICRQVRAPRPSLVQVDCTVNASAGFVHGPLMLLRRDLALTIGLPLAAGLSIRELAGVLAHEFGHFAQGGGMRLTGIVRGVNGWFARVVYERDEWDEKLQRWSKEIDWRLGIVEPEGGGRGRASASARTQGCGQPRKTSWTSGGRGLSVRFHRVADDARRTMRGAVGRTVRACRGDRRSRVQAVRGRAGATGRAGLQGRGLRGRVCLVDARISGPGRRQSPIDRPAD